MSNLTGIFGIYGANITHVAVYRNQNGKSMVVTGINSLNTAEIEKSIEEMVIKSYINSGINRY